MKTKKIEITPENCNCPQLFAMLVQRHCTDPALPTEIPDHYPVIDEEGYIYDVVEASEPGYEIVDWDKETGIVQGGACFAYPKKIKKDIF